MWSNAVVSALTDRFRECWTTPTLPRQVATGIEMSLVRSDAAYNTPVQIPLGDSEVKVILRQENGTTTVTSISEDDDAILVHSDHVKYRRTDETNRAGWPIYCERTAREWDEGVVAAVAEGNRVGRTYSPANMIVSPEVYEQLSGQPAPADSGNGLLIELVRSRIREFVAQNNSSPTTILASPRMFEALIRDHTTLISYPTDHNVRYELIGCNLVCNHYVSEDELIVVGDLPDVLEELNREET